MSAFTNALPRSSSPSSPSTSGTCCATGAASESQHGRVLHQLKLYTCHDATRLSSGSVGWDASQPERRAAYWTPPSMMTLVAPVPRTASTSSCIPAAVKLTPRQDPPSRQQRQASGVSELLSGNGSLNKSKITLVLPL